jgi:hypothetical protein
MRMPDEPYYILVVETYRESGSGLHGDIHVRRIKGQEFSPDLRACFHEGATIRTPSWNSLQNLCEAHE